MAGRKPTIDEGIRALRGLSRPVSTPHLTDEELLAYHQNRLDSAAEERLQDHLAACPGCARDAADLAAFLDPAKAAELDEETDGLSVLEAPPPALPWYRRPAVLQAVAAVLLIFTASSVTAWLLTRDRLQRLEGGEVNVPVEMLVPPGFLREGEAVASGPAEVPPWAVVVLIPASDVPDADHDVEITTLDGHVVWSARGLRPVPPARSFQLRLPFDLADGTIYRIRVAAAGSRPGAQGEVFELRVGVPGPD